MTDRDLVLAAATGDQAAFASVAAQALPRLDAAARLILRDNALAQDAVQEALLLAWRGLPGLREPGRFDAWLHRLVVRACLDQLRTRRRRVAEVELVADIGPLVSDAAANVAQRDLLDRAMARLGPEQRAIVVLRFYLDLTLPGAAEALGIPVGTAKSRLHRALAELRTTLTPVPKAGVAPVQEPWT